MKVLFFLVSSYLSTEDIVSTHSLKKVFFEKLKCEAQNILYLCIFYVFQNNISLAGTRFDDRWKVLIEKFIKTV